jgi:hypothetical protein
MPIIGNQPTQAAFLVDTFSGTGSQTVFTMSVAPANPASVIVAVHGVVQDPSTYSVSGTALTFSSAPPSGTGNISSRYLGIPASGVATTAYRTVTNFTATAGQTTFTPPSYTAGYINVYRNGILLGLADYTATNGVTVVLGTAANLNDLVITESFYVSSVLNAIPATAGAVNSTYLAANLTLTSPTLASPLVTGNGIVITSWTTSTRPANPTTGQVGYNTTTGQIEVYNATYSDWVSAGTSSIGYTTQYLLVGGGGSGGGSTGGGGGGGGFLTGNIILNTGSTYTIVVGSGGAGTASVSPGISGTSSTFNGLVAVGGGGGAYSSNGTSYGPGLNGGSGGGGQNYYGNSAPGSGTVAQGYAGGVCIGTSLNNNGPEGGGGGAGGAGAGGGTGSGGPGAYSSITGANIAYAGGGGGGLGSGSSSGGTGGGGAGGAGATAGTAGTNGLGGGGGGGWNYSNGSGGAGGSGVVILSVPTTNFITASYSGSNVSVSTNGSYTVIKYYSNGTYTA